jgi:cytidylate kinase
MKIFGQFKFSFYLCGQIIYLQSISKMNKNERFVITVNRELGSGGRTVSEKLAAKLGVPFYDKALIEGLREKYHLNTTEIERLKGQQHNWWADFKRVIGIGGELLNPKYYTVEQGEEPKLLTSDDLFNSEQEILKGIAEEGSCVIAGRLAFYVFRDHPNHFNVLIQAPEKFRRERLIKKGRSEAEVDRLICEVDKMRANYVDYYTSTTRYDARNYDLVITMDGRSEDEIADFILKFI